MTPPHLVVIGASAGGMTPLLTLARHLPADFPAALCVVLHIPAYTPSALPEILSRTGPLPALHPSDGQPLRAGHFYVAPPDHHLLIDHDRLLVQKGPKENRVRPAVDVLFRSAAYSHGPAVIGVVLSGTLDDGTSGLWTIKQFGGTTIVQDPQEAEFDSMPSSALAQVPVDHTVHQADLAALLVRLVQQTTQPAEAPSMEDDTRRRIHNEVRIAGGENAFRLGVMGFGKVTPQTCPECGGVLVQIKEGGFTRYRCHTGHAYTADSLLVSVTEHVEETLWATLRTLEEATMLLENTGEEMAESGEARLAAAYEAKAREVEARGRLIFQAVQANERLSREQLQQTTELG